jgi:GntR family transcriptional regulator
MLRDSKRPTQAASSPGNRPTKIDRRLKRIADRVTGVKDGTPKYQVLYDALLGAIESGEWKPGDRLPSEISIAEKVPISLGTVQRALQALVRSGVVTRRHGQGSFVAIQPISESKIRNFRFFADDGEDLLPVYGRVLTVQLSGERGPWTRFLAPEIRFVRLTRLVSINLEVHAFSEVYLPAAKFGEFLEMPPSMVSLPLTHLLTERFNAPTLQVTHALSCDAVPDEVALALKQDLGSLSIHWEIFSYTYRRAPSFYQRVYLPFTKLKLQIPDVAT